MYILRLTYDRSGTTREANTGLIRHAIKEFNWERAFSNTSVNEKVDIFNKTILNILSNFISNEKKKRKKIGSLNSNKARGHDNISIRMFKICGNTICKPLELIFKQALNTGVFLSEWKKAIFSLVTKKATNKTLKIIVQFLYFLSAENFLKDSYLMKCLVFFFVANNLLTLYQSGFKPGDSCINQLLSITFERFIHHLMMDLKLEVFSWIYLKPSIKSGMKGLYLNFSKTVFRMTC